MKKLLFLLLTLFITTSNIFSQTVIGGERGHRCSYDMETNQRFNCVNITQTFSISIYENSIEMIFYNNEGRETRTDYVIIEQYDYRTWDGKPGDFAYSILSDRDNTISLIQRASNTLFIYWNTSNPVSGSRISMNYFDIDYIFEADNFFDGLEDLY